MLSEVFWSFFLTSIIGCIMGILRMIYKSKCKYCSICGIMIERDIVSEEKIDELELNKQSNKENVV
jgi:uncharacterized membrane protein